MVHSYRLIVWSNQSQTAPARKPLGYFDITKSKHLYFYSSVFDNHFISLLSEKRESIVSGDIFDTEFIQLFSKDTRQINKADWQFNWQGQIKLAEREVYKLVIKDNIKIIQGLISLTDKGDHIYMNLIELLR
jgi:hypothetical protein